MATRWGIASAGKICHDFVNALTCLPPTEHKVVAVAARSLDSAQALADKFGVEKALQGYEALAKDPDVEVVYVGTIHVKHLEVAKLMLEGGKHVLCEKPLCINVKETRELVSLAREKGLFLMEAIWSRCIPSHREVDRLIKAGAIGEVKNVLASFGAYCESDRLHQMALGGGTVLDLGIYCIQLAQLAMGKEKPEKIIAGGHLGPDKVDESTSATLLYSGGRTATLLSSAVVNLPCEGFIIGTKGTLKLNSPMWTATVLDTPEGTKSWQLPPGAKHKFNYGNGENMTYEAQHVRECLQAGKLESPLISLDETLLIAEIMESIRKQAGVKYPQDD